MKQFGQNGRNRSWAQRMKGQRMQDRIHEKIDGEEKIARVYTSEEFSQLFAACKLGALALGELAGEELLPRDSAEIAQLQLLGFIDEGAQLSDFVDVREWCGFMDRARFARGEIRVVVAMGDELYSIAA